MERPVDLDKTDQTEIEDRVEAVNTVLLLEQRPVIRKEIKIESLSVYMNNKCFKFLILHI